MSKQPNVIRSCSDKKNKSYIDIKTSFVPNNVQVQSLTEAIRSDIKKNVEYLAEMQLRKLEVNVREIRKLLVHEC